MICLQNNLKNYMKNINEGEVIPMANEQCDGKKVVFRVCDKCRGEGKVCYGGMGDVFIYECPACDGTGHKR